MKNGKVLDTMKMNMTDFVGTGNDSVVMKVCKKDRALS